MDATARFADLFREGYPALQRYALHRGLTAADADDLVPGTLEVAWRRLDDVPADEPLPWLYGVAHNLNGHTDHGRRLRQPHLVGPAGPAGKILIPGFTGCSLTGFAPVPTPLPAGGSLASFGSLMRQFISQGY